MTSLTTRIRNFAFALGIAGALGFGVLTASAAAQDGGSARKQCPFYTSSAAVCAYKCAEYGFSGWAWDPSTFCCECFY